MCAAMRETLTANSQACWGVIIKILMCLSSSRRICSPSAAVRGEYPQAPAKLMDSHRCGQQGPGVPTIKQGKLKGGKLDHLNQDLENKNQKNNKKVTPPQEKMKKILFPVK